MQEEKTLKSEDRVHKGMEVDVKKVLKAMDRHLYRIDEENRTIYLLEMHEFFEDLGITVPLACESYVWQGWLWENEKPSEEG